jgi:hypothetical protein
MFNVQPFRNVIMKPPPIKLMYASKNEKQKQKTTPFLGVVAHTCNLSTQEAEAGGLKV